MKKRIWKQTGIFCMAFLIGGIFCGNCIEVRGDAVENTEICDGVEEMELWDGDAKEEAREEQAEEEQAEGGREEETAEENENADTGQDFSVSLHGDPVLKAGEKAVYQILLTNTGVGEISDILLANVFSCPKITWEWQPAPGLEISGQDARLVILEPGQEAALYVTAQLLPEQKEALTHTVTAAAKDGIVRTASVTGEVEPLTADFTVEKTADRSMAAAGEEIVYQICIQNTGELPLHSIVTTERFLKEGIKAQFAETEGVELNGAKDKALIPLLNPGEGIVLKATVKLPETGVEGELLNEVIVFAKETGEKEVIAQAAVQALKPRDTPVPASLPKERSIPRVVTKERKASEVPKTGDFMKTGEMKDLFQTAGAVCILLPLAVKGKRKR